MSGAGLRFIYMNLSQSTISTIFGVVIGLTAYALGRNIIIWFLLGYTLPVLAVVLLIIRHRTVPKDSPEWLSDGLQKIWVRRWSRKLKPDDFRNPPENPPPKEL